LAAAVCHFQFWKSDGEKSYTGWDAFVKQGKSKMISVQVF
jgi:hypothetical protein